MEHFVFADKKRPNKLAKSLLKMLAAAGSPRSLAQSRELLARIMGHDDWHAMEKATGTPSSLDQSVSREQRQARRAIGVAALIEAGLTMDAATAIYDQLSPSAGSDFKPILAGDAPWCAAFGIQVGAVIFDDPEILTSGWFARPGASGRFDAMSELDAGTIWWTNTGNRIVEPPLTFLVRKFLIVSPLDILREWGMTPEATEPRIVAEVCAAAFDRVIATALFLMRQSNPQAKLSLSALDTRLRLDGLLPASEPAPPAPGEESWEDFVATGARGHRGGIWLMLRCPRTAYARKMLDGAPLKAVRSRPSVVAGIPGAPQSRSDLVMERLVAVGDERVLTSMPAAISELLRRGEPSWSLGVIAETLWRTAFEDRQSAAGDWMRQTDRLEMLGKASALASKGWPVVSFGMGWLRISVIDKDVNAAVRDGFALGMLPLPRPGGYMVDIASWPSPESIDLAEMTIRGSLHRLDQADHSFGASMSEPSQISEMDTALDRMVAGTADGNHLRHLFGRAVDDRAIERGIQMPPERD